LTLILDDHSPARLVSPAFSLAKATAYLETQVYFLSYHVDAKWQGSTAGMEAQESHWLQDMQVSGFDLARPAILARWSSMTLGS
jgi:hypothetical protein